MSRFLTFLTTALALLLCTFNGFAQPDIVEAEYFFDTDPGFGNATPLSFTQAPVIDISPVLVQGLSPGTHQIGVRAKDQNGTWGFSERRHFFIPSSTTADPPVYDIQAMEYYFNDDPGAGNGTAIVVSSGSLVDLPNEILASSTLPAGFHVLGIRSQNTNGDWGFPEHRIFYIPPGTTSDPPPADIEEMEYFFDDDPGHGNASPLTVPTASVVDINPLIPQSLPQGFHTIHIRAKNTDGIWGPSETRVVYIRPPTTTSSIADIVEMEYFIDSPDPGVGNATDLPITPGPLVDLDPVNIPTSPGLIDGQHNFTIRAKNADGIWGMAETSTFDVLDDCTQPTADFNPMLACAGEAVTFEDLSVDLQPDAQYRWYFNGDNIADDFTSGTTTFTFTNPGMYDVGLAISQGTICYDSIGYTIEIIAKPVVLFSASGLVIDQPTNFNAVFSNVDPGATWDWDFDGDMVVDDNTQGSTSHTYTSTGPVTASVRVYDGSGCETTYSQGFVVGDGSGGGSGTPAADFVAASVCDGQAMQFLDVSSNVPGGSVYSWDFDGDDIVDDNTFGSTSHTYATAGDYTAKLTIDVGGGNMYVQTKSVSIKPIPVVSFSATDVCDGQQVDFVDATTGALPGGTYHWDFDGNGSIDNNTAGNTSYTYSQPGQYTALLLVDNGSGCFESFTHQVNVIPVPAPDFGFSGECSDNVVSFINLSSGTTGSSQYTWDLDGDGTPDLTGVNSISFVYPSAGDYNAKLTIDNGNGCITEVIKTVSITDQPVADFEVSAGCAGDPLTFTDLSTNLSSPTYSWDFVSNGTEDDNTVGSTTFAFPDAGTYTARLTVTNGGCISTVSKTFSVTPVPVPMFSVSGGCSGTEYIFFDLSEDLTGSAVYSWDFDGDGTEDHAEAGDAFFTFDTPGTYDARLRIDNGNGCIETFTETLIIAEIPEPSFEILSTCIGQPSQFVDLSAKVAAGATYSWDFDGDGTIDDTTVGNTTYTFDVYKPYVATLTINNGLGCVQSVDVIVDFTGAAAPDFKVGKTCLNEEVVFTDISAELATGAVYSWDFNGDGLEDSAHPGTTTYTFTRPGVYNASLTIFNADLCSATRTIPIEISPLPDVSIGDDVQLCTEGTVTLDAGEGYASYFWKGGSTDQTLTVDTFGEYWVSITDVKGCTNLDTVQVRLKDLPVSAFDYTITYSPTDGIVVAFSNNSKEADSPDAWQWDFGDGGSSDDENPVHTYTEFSFYRVTPYTVCLTATDRCGITDQMCQEIFLSPLDIFDDADKVLTLYPNPGSGVFQVSSKEVIDNLTIVDGTGKLVRSYDKPVQSLEMDITSEKPGLFLLLAQVGDRQFVKRIIFDKRK